jgi:hypothetical protein
MKAILIEKTKYDILIKCNKEGFQEATYMNKSGAAGATFGNIVLGGGIGWAVDSATGSDNKYDSPVNLSLVPLYAAAAPPAPTASAPAPVADTSTQAEAAPASAEAETAQAPAPVRPDFPPPPR